MYYWVSFPNHIKFLQSKENSLFFGNIVWTSDDSNVSFFISAVCLWVGGAEMGVFFSIW